MPRDDEIAKEKSSNVAHNHVEINILNQFWLGFYLAAPLVAHLVSSEICNSIESFVESLLKPFVNVYTKGDEIGHLEYTF